MISSCTRRGRLQIEPLGTPTFKQDGPTEQTEVKQVEKEAMRERLLTKGEKSVNKETIAISANVTKGANKNQNCQFNLAIRKSQ